MGNINKSEDIINILFNYCKEHFDDFGHRDWFKTEFGSSWSPFVETCFILYGEKIYESNPRDNIRHDYTKPNIGWFMDIIHKKIYNKDTKYKKGKSDINFIENGNFILSLEHSEDVPSKQEIEKYKKLIDYVDTDDQDAEKDETKKQLIAMRQEVSKLKKFDSKFKVITSRPKLFDKINGNTNPSYSDSVEYFKKQIETDLKKDAKTFNDNETWVIILIAPQPDNNPTEIIFYCYEWKGNELADLDERRIQIKPKDIKKW